MKQVVHTRLATTHRNIEAARREASMRSYQEFMAKYKGLTPAQRKVQRHNRFLKRIWKIPMHERVDHRVCVACHADFLDDEVESHMVIQACDHPIHLECFHKHVKAYMQRMQIPTIDELDEDADQEVLRDTCSQEIFFKTCGAPCPMCRMQFPMQHMLVFDDAGC